MKFLQNHKRTLLLGLVDAVICVFACLVANYTVEKLTEWDFYREIYIPTNIMLMNILLITVFTVFGLYIAGVYRCMWRFAHANDYMRCIFGTVISAMMFGIVSFVARYNFCRTIICLNYLLIFIFIYMSRTIYVSFCNVLSNKHNAHNVRTLVVGAGYTGNKVISEMKHSDTGYRPILAVDDDLQKQKKNIHGILVKGTVDNIPKLVEENRIKAIIVATPSCTAQEKSRILSICAETMCEVKVIPPLHQLIINGDFMGQAREINPDELLGRDVIQFENYAVTSMICGKVCMVTGGGGSIGSELCRQIARFEPKKLIIVDIYENNAYDIQQELLAKHDNINLDVRIASVRDYDKMEALFQMFRPEFVFHAAAHKHVPLMETSPEEAIKNNICGTYNVAHLANKYKAKKFVLVSTDKAVNPTNVMGATKRCCEMIAQYFAQISEYTEFVAVRFGNVLGSNGSVIPLFEKQIAAGGPVTVTHPDIIRYFMTIPEAVSLILQAGAMAHGGEIFVLDMGDPVKILTLAENLIKLHGKEPYVDIDIKFTGLRPGEKLFEELLMSEEGMRETANKKIFIGTQIQIDENTFADTIEYIKNIAYTNNSEEAVEVLRKIVPTFNHAVIR